MARGHWLDPLARQVLWATGQLPKASLHKPPIQAPPWRIDVNRATAAEWLKLPGCSEEMAALLVRLQQGGVQLSGADDLIKLLHLSTELAERWRPHLLFRWYGDSPPGPEPPPLDLNAAAVTTLEEALNWPPGRLQRLIRERQRRPFANLADLQERLTLPAAAIEQLIGSVSFGARSAGPKLPPRS